MYNRYIGMRFKFNHRINLCFICTLYTHPKWQFLVLHLKNLHLDGIPLVHDVNTKQITVMKHFEFQIFETVSHQNQNIVRPMKWTVMTLSAFVEQGNAVWRCSVQWKVHEPNLDVWVLYFPYMEDCSKG